MGRFTERARAKRLQHDKTIDPDNKTLDFAALVVT